MPDCGSQCWLCDLPIRFDTYRGCSHGCSYCFANRNSDITNIRLGETVGSLRAFINGSRNANTRWCDWNIPIHWGGMSDPFQPCEKIHKRSLEALEVFSESGYPVVISTKGKLCVEEPYISLIEKSNAVIQISVLCDKYDEIEAGAPRFSERVEMIRLLAKRAKRVIVRAQPYIHDILMDMLSNIPIFADAGAYGIIFEGMKFVRKKAGLVKSGADWVQNKRLLESDFTLLRNKCHEYGIKFYAGENRLRGMGDSLTCCGIDGLDGFKPNTWNINHFINGDFSAQPTDQMSKPKTGSAFYSLYQETTMYDFVHNQSFEGMMHFIMKNKRSYIESVMRG